jgi:K+-sensing histidine kinase KdpD
VRWQRAAGEQRQQLKWLVYVGSLIILCGIIGFVCSYLPISAYIGVLVGAVGFTGTSIGIPLAIGFAMLRYHLYDIDVLINRTLVYGTLTGILAIIYLGGVFGLQIFLRNMTGQASQPDLAIVGSTLAIAALFQPLRNRIQDTIDRRFYRRRYDAAHTLEAFSAKLREEVDLTQISEQLVAVVEETMQPQHVSLWLRQSAQSKEDSSNMHHPRL